MLRQASENVPLAVIVSMLEQNQLPDFEKFEKYAPSGTFAYDEPAGIHFGSFTLRPMKIDSNEAKQLFKSGALINLALTCVKSTSLMTEQNANRIRALTQLRL